MIHSCVISTFSRDNTMRRSALPKHLAQVPNECLRLLKRRKMSSFVVSGLEDQLPNRVRPPVVVVSVLMKAKHR